MTQPASLALTNKASEISAEMRGAIPLPIIIAWLQAAIMVLQACNPTPQRAYDYVTCVRDYRLRRIRRELVRQWSNWQESYPAVDPDQIADAAFKSMQAAVPADMESIYTATAGQS